MTRDRQRLSPVAKPTTTQLARRRAAVLRYRDEGYSNDEIAEALSISRTVVVMDVMRLIKAGETTRAYRTPGRGFTPEPVRWWEEPPRPTVPIYVRSTTLGIWRRAAEHDTDTRGIDCLRGDARDAAAAGDLAWLQDALNVITRAEELLRQHRQTIEAARAHVRPPLRSVP